MDKNSITGFLLIGLLVFAFSWYNKPSEAQLAAKQRYQDSVALVKAGQQRIEAERLALEQNIADNSENLSDSARQAVLTAEFGSFASSATGKNEIITLENDLLELRLSTKGGLISYARLKEYSSLDSLPLILFDERDDSYGFTFITANQRVINTATMYFEAVNKTDNSVTLRLSAGDNAYIDFVYSIQPESYVVKFDINQSNMGRHLAPNTSYVNMFWEQTMRRQERGKVFEERYSNLYYKFVADDVDYLSASGDAKETFTNRLKWIGYKNQFFSSVLISRDGFGASVLDSRFLKNDPLYLKKFRSEAEVDFNLANANPASFDFFLGPNSYPLLTDIDKELGGDLELTQLVPLGMSVFRWVNKFLVIPTFSFLSKFISNYGIIILLLTIFIKMILMPFTYKSYISQAKMKTLRPEIQEINAKYPGQDNAMQRQKATMELYGKAGINPMGGCLPMVLQMPILFAMFQFFPSSIELRGESFLWAHDLSSYDSIFSWDAYIPIITPYFGNHISLFCLLMTVTNIIYTRLNMANSAGQEQMPGMKIMMYGMPLMFLFIFNNYAAGLSYYYFISTLITIGQTYLFRLFIDENKLKTEMLANAKNPKKKTGFMARLEEAQRLQQEQVKRQQQQKNKRK